MAKNPHVFIVGCPRSGTTLLQRMLDNHGDLAVANDTHFIPRVIAKETETDPRLTADLVERVRSYRRLDRLGLTEEHLSEAAFAASSFSEFVSLLYDAFAHLHGKTLAGEKTPDYGQHIDRLISLFPEARFIHIVRDGRDVALSTIDWANPTKGPGRWTLWPVSPMAASALWWRWQVEPALQARATHGLGKVLELRYEDLVSAPEFELDRITRFLGIPYDVEMARYFEGKEKSTANRSAKSAWLRPTQGLRDWRTQMSEHDLALFEALCGDLLETLGYGTYSEKHSLLVAEEADLGWNWWQACNGKPRTMQKLIRNAVTSLAA